MLNAMTVAGIGHYFNSLTVGTGAQNPTKLFNITPPVETRLREGMLEKTEFLSLITMTQVSQITGQVADLGTSDIHTGRKAEGRFRRPVGISGNTYHLVETDSCATIPWSMLCQWGNAGSPGEFVRKMNAYILKAFARDILRVAFNGTRVATGDTDPVANKLGQDVNKGWLQIVKDGAPNQVLSSATLDPSGAAANSHKNLDALATDLRNSIIAEQFCDDDDLVVLVGRDLIASEQGRLMGEANLPTEHNAAQMLSKSFGGMKVFCPAFFPRKGLWVTSLSNLQVIHQTGTQWRKAANEEDRKQFENSWLRMEGFGIGNFEKFAAIEIVNLAGETRAENA